MEKQSLNVSIFRCGIRGECLYFSIRLEETKLVSQGEVPDVQGYL